MAAGEKSAYQRGYNRGRARSDGRILRIVEITKGWRKKATDGYGSARCDNCEYWVSGGELTSWGMCNQEWFSSPDRGRIWAETANHERAQIITHDNAFCSNWLPKPKDDGTDP